MARKLLYLNGLAIISVVLYHASARGFISMFWWAHRYRPVGEVNFDQLGNIEYYSLRIIEQMVIFAIPAFILVSGYFVAVATGRSNITIGWKTVLTRIRDLAIPFVIWSTIYLLLSILFGARYTLTGFLWIVLTGNAVPPFYFIPLLIQLYLLSPFLVPLARNWWKLVLGAAAGVQILVLIFRYVAILRPDLTLYSNLSRSILFPSYIFWFLLGIVIGFNLTQFKNMLVKYKRILTTSVFLFFVFGIFEWEMLFHLSGKEWIAPSETLIDQLYALSIILSLIACENIQFPLTHKVTNLGVRSYGIYLTHTLALVYTSKYIYNLAPSVMEYQIIFQSILVFTGLGIPLMIMYIIEISPFRKYYTYLFN